MTRQAEHIWAHRRQALLKSEGKPLIFPGTHASYTSIIEATSAKLLARMMEWAALGSDANQAFNAVNGDVTRWSIVWPTLAAHLGMAVEAPTARDAPAGPTVLSLLDGKDAAWSELCTAHGLRRTELRDLVPIPFLQVRTQGAHDTPRAPHYGTHAHALTTTHTLC